MDGASVYTPLRMLGALGTFVALLAVMQAFARVRAAGPLTPASRVTLARGILIAALAWFVLVPLWGIAAWLPGPIYTAAAAADWIDGYLARRRGEATAAGARFDVEIDALGLLVGSLVAVGHGLLPPWYLALGAAYYLFKGGLWLRERLGRPVHRERLRRNPYARVFAGLQMALVAVSLYPVRRPSLDVVATLLMTPTLVMFAREWWLATRPG